MVTVNGEPTEIDRNVNKNDQLVVYPHFYQFELKDSESQQNSVETQLKFVLDVHLGKLAAKLRLLGFDSVYNNMLDDNEIINIARSENRIVLSRDLGIFKNSKVKKGYFPRSQDPKIQLKEIVDRYGLKAFIKPFSRCIKCNTELKPVDKELIKNVIPKNTNLYYQEFHSCANCNRTYWKGSHYDKMMEMVGKFSEN